MEVRDPVHGSIEIHELEKPVLEHRFFQRLRSIKQLGFSELIVSLHPPYRAGTQTISVNNETK